MMEIQKQIIQATESELARASNRITVLAAIPARAVPVAGRVTRPLSERQKRLVQVLEILRVEGRLRAPRQRSGACHWTCLRVLVS